MHRGLSLKVDIGERLLQWRWGLVALAAAAVLIFEIVEHQPHEEGVREDFIWEILFLGLALPLLVGLLLNWLASVRMERVWAIYYRSLHRNLRMLLSGAHSRDELAVEVLQFLRLVMPLVGASLLVYDQASRRYDTILDWSLKKGDQLPELPNRRDAERCAFNSAAPEDGELVSTPCRCLEASATNGDARSCFCLPFHLSSSPVGGVRLFFPPGMAPTTDHLKALAEVIPEIAVAIEQAQLMHAMKMQNESLVAEQHRIARDVHDTLGHSLAFLRLKLDQITEELTEAEMEAIYRDVEMIRDVAKEAYDQMRDVLIALAPESHGDLNDSLLNYANKMRQRVDFKLQLQYQGQQHSFSPSIQRQIFLLFQEALTNIEKHAQAQQVDVILNWQEVGLEMIIADDGQGFNMKKANSDGHFGLKNMQSRARDIDGMLNVASAPGKGTRVSLWLPYEG